MTPKIIPLSHPFLIHCPSIQDVSFLNMVQQLIDHLIPESLWTHESEPLPYRLKSALPLFLHSPIQDDSTFVSITYLCPAEIGVSARKFVINALTKQLLADKHLEITGGLHLNFEFAQAPGVRFFIAHEILALKNLKETQAIQKNLPDLLSQLKEKISSEFLRPSENLVHPIFMPRNEEETIRNLILLAGQIKYVRDLPQVSIHYEKQTEKDLTFTLIISRVLKKTAEPLKKTLEKSPLKIDVDDVRIMGYLKQKYPKEAAILRITLNKRPFFRPNYSLDLLKARQKIVSELSLCLGEFRDFNGGMILKQNEALNLLKNELGKLSHQKEFLLEDYFYSLKPVIMQTAHDTAVLKRHFEQLCHVLAADLKQQPYRIVGEQMGKFFLCFVAATAPTFKEAILKAIAPLEISSRDLTISFLEIEEISTMGFILQVDSSEVATRFEAAILGAFHEWSHRFYCTLGREL